MQINITGHHLEITPFIRDFANEKLSRLEKHFNHGITSVDLIF